MQMRTDSHCRGAQQEGNKLCSEELAVWVSAADEGQKISTAQDLEVASALRVLSEGEGPFLMQLVP